MSEVSINLTKSQADFVNLDCYYPLFVGGPGCGKSYTLGLIAVLDALHSKQANIYIYAPENHHIRTIEVPNVIYWLDQFKIKHFGFNQHESCIKTDDPRCGMFYFKNMESSANLVGYESYRAHVDELDTLDEKKAEEIWRAILMRNRQQPEGVPEEHLVYNEERGRKFAKNVVRAYTTPEGYKFCYKNWELKDRPTYKQIKGKTSDNPALAPDYEQNLREQYPKYIADAYLTGQFVNMQSLSVYFNYNPDLHNSFEKIEGTENLYIGCDFNVDNTSATVFVRRNGGKEWHAVDELTGIRDAATLADMISKRYIGHKIYMYPDCSGNQRSNANSANRTSIRELQDKGFIIRANARNYLVSDRINATNKAFATGRLFINQKACPAVMRCLVNQAYDKHGKPDKKTGYDHQNDATTYPIIYELGYNKLPTPIQVGWL